MKPIPKTNKKYFATECGRIYSAKSGRFLTPRAHSHGYLRVSISKKDFYVHRLIMKTFLGDSKKQVNHKNGIKKDNRLSNLEYVSCKDNMRHGWDIGLFSHHGERNKKSFLSESIVKNIFWSSDSYKHLSEKYKCSEKTISNIKSGISWSRVDFISGREDLVKQVKKIPKNIQNTIKKSKFSYALISKKYGININLIKVIKLNGQKSMQYIS